MSIAVVVAVPGAEIMLHRGKRIRQWRGGDMPEAGHVSVR